MIERNILSKVLFSAIFSLLIIGQTFAQDRPRVVTSERNVQKSDGYRESQPTMRTPSPAVRISTPVSRPTLANQIRVIAPSNPMPLVRKTVSSTPTNLPANSYASNQSLAAFNSRLMMAMQSKIGIPYHYGSDGPNTYDCSGLVWSVFQKAGLTFDRTSAKSYWNSFEPVYGDDRYKFGTLVFFNKLGHVGIVIDENTFYQASSSKGVTFSPFAGYWEKRIVGFRRIPMNF